MLITLYHLAGAFIITFIARLAVMALPAFGRTSRTLLRAHATAFALVVLLVVAVRMPAGAFAPLQLMPYLAGQLFWLQYDVFARKYLRKRRSAG